METTLSKALSIAGNIDAGIDERDISIPQRLPRKSGRVKPIIFKFTQRIA